MGTANNGTAKGRRRADARRRQATPMLSEMLRADPALTGKVTADDIDSATAAGHALELLAGDLKLAESTVRAASKASYDKGWQGASVVQGAAEAVAVESTTVAEKLAEVQAVLANGPRTKTAPMAVAKADANAVAVANRARKAAVRAAKKVRSATRTAEAHADAHPDVTIIPATDPTTPPKGTNGK